MRTPLDASQIRLAVTVLKMVVTMSVVDQLDITTADACLSHRVTYGTVPADAPWPRKLEAAQNVIFCKEVFAQVSKCIQVFTWLSRIVLSPHFLRYSVFILSFWYSFLFSAWCRFFPGELDLSHRQGYKLQREFIIIICLFWSLPSLVFLPPCMFGLLSQYQGKFE